VRDTSGGRLYFNSCLYTSVTNPLMATHQIVRNSSIQTTYRRYGKEFGEGGEATIGSCRVRLLQVIDNGHLLLSRSSDGPLDVGFYLYSFVGWGVTFSPLLRRCLTPSNNIGKFLPRPLFILLGCRGTW
jgi:hypothetical protein